MVLIYLPYKTEYKKREKVIVKRKELSEDAVEVLNLKLSLLHSGMMISVVYYKDQEYVKKEGILSKIDIYNKTLTIVKEIIKIEDLISIETEEINLDYND